MLALALPAFAQQPPTPEQLLDAVHKNADLSATGPYTLTATVVGNPGKDAKPQNGQLRIDRDHDRLRVELDMPGYREVRLTLGDKLYVSKGQGTLRAAGLAEFDRVWDPLYHEPGSLPIQVKNGKLSRKTVQGVEAECFDEKNKNGLKTHFCIDPARSVLLSKDQGHYGSTDYSGYTRVSGHLVPGRVEIHKPSVKDLVVQNIAVAFHPADAARFAIPEQSIELASCEDIRAPNAVFTPNPDYKPKQSQVTLLLHILVDSAGKVIDVKVLNGTDAGLTDNATKTVSTWKFRPATCAGRPVATEMMVEIGFDSY